MFSLKNHQTRRQAFSHGAAYLASRGVETAVLDAELLLAYVLSLERTRLLFEDEQLLSTSEKEAYQAIIERRSLYEPVAYLVGKKEFWGLDFSVDPRVLIPRPDSETLVEEALFLFEKERRFRFVDVGTGSGCLTGALLTAFKRATGVACDLSKEALDVARTNLTLLGVVDRVQFFQGDLLNDISAGSFDLVCANLPYIPTEEMALLPPDVFTYEPKMALDGGGKGLALIERLVRQAIFVLLPKAWLLLEVGHLQANEVLQLCKKAGFSKGYSRKDLGGVERIVAAQTN